MNLIAESVPGVKPDTKVVSTSYTTKDGENRVSFNGRPAGKWVPGKYRADIFVDGNCKKPELSIKAQGGPVTASRSFAPDRKPQTNLLRPGLAKDQIRLSRLRRCITEKSFYLFYL